MSRLPLALAALLLSLAARAQTEAPAPPQEPPPAQEPAPSAPAPAEPSPSEQPPAQTPPEDTPPPADTPAPEETPAPAPTPPPRRERPAPKRAPAASKARPDAGAAARPDAGAPARPDAGVPARPDAGPAATATPDAGAAPAPAAAAPAPPPPGPPAADADLARDAALRFLGALLRGELRPLSTSVAYPFVLEGRRLETPQAFVGDWGRAVRGKRTDLLTLDGLELLTPAQMEAKHGRPPARLAALAQARGPRSYFAVATLSGRPAVLLVVRNEEAASGAPDAFRVAGYSD